MRPDFDVLAKEYYARIRPDIRDDFRAQAELFFSFWGQHRHYLTLLERDHLLYILFAKFEAYLVQMSESGEIEEDNRYYSAFFAGGLWATLLAWIRHDFKETPSELANVVFRFEAIGLFRRIPF